MAVTFGHGGVLTFAGFTSEIVGISGPSLARDSIDTTHHGTGNNFRTFIPGLVDPGELTIDCHFDPTETPGIDGNAAVLKITWPDTGSTKFQATEAFITGFDITDPIDDKMTASVTFKLSGSIDFAAA